MAIDEQASAGAAGGGRRAVRRRTRLARGPLTIGEAAAAIEPQLASAEPYRPDTIADGGTAAGLTVRAASVRGLFKRYAGGPRQDDLCLRVHEPTRSLIVAVADGVSGAPRSHLGAALAVRQAAAAVAAQLDRDELDWGAVFHQAAWSLVQEQRRADPEAGVPEAAAELATTLALAVVTGSRVRAATVGDSPVLVLRDGAYTVLAGPAVEVDGLLGGAVAALPRTAEGAATAETALGAGAVLLVCTDGLALPLGDGTGEVGRAFARELARVPDVVDFARLLDFSRSTYDDDRTLVAVWPP